MALLTINSTPFLLKVLSRKLSLILGATSKTVSGTLQPGDGKVFIAGLAKEQTMELKLQANSQVLLSIYSPSGKIQFLEDSKQRTLSTKLPENGFYEFVVVSTASEPVDYQLSITAENPTPPHHLHRNYTYSNTYRNTYT